MLRELRSQLLLRLLWMRNENGNERERVADVKMEVVR